MSGLGVGDFLLEVCVFMRSQLLTSNHPKDFRSLARSLVSPAHEKANINFSCAHQPQLGQDGNCAVAGVRGGDICTMVF